MTYSLFHLSALELARLKTGHEQKAHQELQQYKEQLKRAEMDKEMAQKNEERTHQELKQCKERVKRAEMDKETAQKIEAHTENLLIKKDTELIKVKAELLYVTSERDKLKEKYEKIPSEKERIRNKPSAITELIPCYPRIEQRTGKHRPIQ